MMHDEKPFFMRAPWHFDPDYNAGASPDSDLGFDTRALHAGFRPLRDVETFRSFVTPIAQSMTYPYEHFDNFRTLFMAAAKRQPSVYWRNAWPRSKAARELSPGVQDRNPCSA
jgi:hypothetical protein